MDLIIRIDEGIALIRRDNPPYEGRHALPGGFVEIGERVEDAARREAKEETGLDVGLLSLVGVYSDPGRDPRGHVVSICFSTSARGELRAGSDARSAEIFPLNSLPELAFDHGLMIRDFNESMEAE